MADILIVDDDDMVRRVMQRMLETNGYICRCASNGQEARELLNEKTCDLLLCDVQMPEESGMALAEYVLHQYPDTAAVMVTAVDDIDVAQSMLSLGVYDYVIKPVDRSAIIISVANALRRRELEIANRNYRRDLEKTVDERTQSLKSSMKKLETTMEGIVHVIASTVETRDPYTAGHQRRVADLASSIAEQGGLDPDRIQAIYMASTVHDLGKISVPAEILSKPSRLSASEFNLIKEHPKVAYEIIRGIEFPWPIATIVYQHHERLDGSGYPLGLLGDAIMLESRILSIADVVEAMASHRPYRPSLGIDCALREITDHSGTLYDASFGAICIRLFTEKGYVMS